MEVVPTFIIKINICIAEHYIHIKTYSKQCLITVDIKNKSQIRKLTIFSVITFPELGVSYNYTHFLCQHFTSGKTPWYKRVTNNTISRCIVQLSEDITLCNSYLLDSALYQHHKCLVYYNIQWELKTAQYTHVVYM